MSELGFPLSGAFLLLISYKCQDKCKCDQESDKGHKLELNN